MVLGLANDCFCGGGIWVSRVGYVLVNYEVDGEEINEYITLPTICHRKYPYIQEIVIIVLRSR